jgi:hypothetical protein
MKTTYALQNANEVQSLLWEYCVLQLFGRKIQRNHITCNMSIYYLGTEGKIQMLSTMQGEDIKRWMYDPWAMTVGLLGRSEWELISIQHVAVSRVWPFGTVGFLMQDQAIAYFKRPIRVGRRIDEPLLNYL